MPFPSAPEGITRGPDGALWYTNNSVSYGIGRITTAGVVTEYQIPISGFLGEITSGPGGALWFTQAPLNGASKVGRLTTAGVYSEYAVPTTNAGVSHITRGPDGALWFTETFASQIGRLGH